ncbi:hypothetical protein PABG_12436 [Paracoccidioides brasiliensis Pb03]|nr:hypothetical protein PABG_12436 [Paracoccidioides brasiliensis Pb03]
MESWEKRKKDYWPVYRRINEKRAYGSTQRAAVILFGHRMWGEYTWYHREAICHPWLVRENLRIISEDSGTCGTVKDIVNKRLPDSNCTDHRLKMAAIMTTEKKGQEDHIGKCKSLIRLKVIPSPNGKLGGGVN